MREVISEMVDDDELLEVHERWAPHVRCVLARLVGETVGIAANQDAELPPRKHGNPPL